MENELPQELELQVARWLKDERNQERLQDILAIDPSANYRIGGVKTILGGTTLHYDGITNARLSEMKKIIRELNPEFWDENKALLARIAKAELLKISPESGKYLIF